MKILYIVTTRMPTEKAYGFQVSKVCEQLARAGADVSLWYPDRGDDSDVFSAYSVAKNFTARKISYLFQPLTRLIPGRFFRTRTTLFLLGIIRERVERDVVIVSRSPEVIWYFGVRGYKTIFYAHNWPEQKSFLMRRSLARVRGVIANSRGTASEYVLNGIMPVQVIPNGVDLDIFTTIRQRDVSGVRTELGLPVNKKIVLYAGHLYEWKGADVLLETARMFTHDDSVCFVFVGGTAADVLQFEAKAKGCNNVYIVGHKPKALIPSYITAADVLVLPNVPVSKESERYTSPIKMFEYMASGVPIVASDLPSLREVLSDQSALFVEPGNPQTLGDAIKEIFSETSSAKARAERALHDVREYTWEKQAAHILDFVRKVSAHLSKRVVILQHDGGEFANQVWNHISIIAYAHERGYSYSNPSFFEYTRWFEKGISNSFMSSLFSLPYTRRFSRKTSFKIRFWRKLYKAFVVKSVHLFASRKILFSNQAKTNPMYLPPTQHASEPLAALEHSESPTLYFANVNGAMFRNPAGILKYRSQIVASITPRRDVLDTIEKFLAPIRARFKTVVAVHIRQTDYKTFKNGKFFVDQARVAEILHEYIKEKQVVSNDIAFVVTSDEAVDETVFKGLNVFRNMGGTVITDTFLLSRCDAVIGSDSTLGHFAAYYGNIPHIIVKREPMDWEYYKDVTQYQPNKYLTVMPY
jgi:glycosyltransferase involved in cell wall biosynthesis